MISLPLSRPDKPLSVLCLGAHSDDIEIGAGGTILTWIEAGTKLGLHWCVLSAAGARAKEAQASARSFTAGASSCEIEMQTFRDGYFPAEQTAIKDWFEELKSRCQPDVILTHHRDDAHQDHRIIAELTSNTFRDHLVLAYEIPKWDGDLGRPGTYMPLAKATLERKITLLMEHFATQRSKDWFDPEVFRGLARLRGMECRAPERYAEAFHVSKMVLR